MDTAAKDQSKIDFQIRPGLRVLITGGGDGIGRIMAKAFADRGASVFVCDISQDALRELAKANPSIEVSLTDVSDRQAVDKMFVKVKQRLSGLDVMINNAGIAGPTAVIDEIEPRDWERTIAVNLNGQYYCLRHAVPLLRASKGSIINVSSVAGRLGCALRTPYAASKWAVVGLTKSLANELGPGGIRVNSILPGPVEGDRMEKVIEARARALNLSIERAHLDEIRVVSLRRFTKPEDVASMALYLCTPAGSFISGQALSVCGNVETQ
jgi:NAD(P)-dependent dehydrogenase (short-subunit alcohol dehydrogenase family)